MQPLPLLLLRTRLPRTVGVLGLLPALLFLSLLLNAFVVLSVLVLLLRM